MKSSVCFLFIYCNPHDHPPNLTLLLSPMQFHSHFFSTSGFNVGTEKKKKKKKELELFKAQQSRLTDCKNTQSSIIQLGILIGLYHQ